MCNKKERTEDKRYIRVERAIQNTIDEMYLEGNIITKVLDFSKRANIDPSTFYAHYPGIGAAITARDDRMKTEFIDYLQEGISKNSKSPPNSTLEIIFSRMFIFICKNEGYFQALAKRSNIGAFRDATAFLKPVAEQKWLKFRLWDTNRQTKIDDIFYKYSFEILQVFSRWAEIESFNPRKIKEYTRHLIYLTDTACQRLGGLVENQAL